MRGGCKIATVLLRVATVCMTFAPAPGSTQPTDLRHEGYVCDDLEGARAVAAEMLNEAQGHDTVWDVIDAVRAEGYDCTHTRGAPLRVKVIATIEAIKGTADPPLHILEARAPKEKANVFIITALE